MFIKVDKKLIYVLDNIEQPLEPVLASMEATGIRIDVNYLKELSSELSQNLAHLEAEVYQASGTNFNLASPKQLGEVLFQKLSLF